MIDFQKKSVTILDGAAAFDNIENEKFLVLILSFKN